MYWPLDEVSSSTRERLVRLSRGEDLPPNPCYFRRRPPWTKLTGMAIGGVVALLVLGAIAYNYVESDDLVSAGIAAAIAAVDIVWLACIALEAARAIAGRVRAFFLLTPRVLIECDHQGMTAFRLAEATKFKTSTFYDRKQKFAGHQLDFTFPECSHSVKLRERLDVLGQVLDRARAGGSDLGSCGLELMPPAGGAPRRPAWRAFSNPGGEFWLVTVALVLLAVIVGAIVRSWL